MTDYTFYRGQSDFHLKLIPSIFRQKKADGKDWQYNINTEKDMLESFKKKSVLFLEKEPSTDLEWLTVAQHFGLPTRLLDWTQNPLVALFFAVEKDLDNDGAVFALKTGKPRQSKTIKKPFDLQKVEKIIPFHISVRQIAQDSVFTIHPNHKDPYDNLDVYRVKISKDAKVKIRYELAKYGVTDQKLFPGLEGLCKTIKQDHIW